jgi:hypothetical protein
VILGAKLGASSDLGSPAEAILRASELPSAPASA